MKWKNTSVLVTGVTGFIGSNLTKELLRRGVKIVGIDNFSYINIKIARKKLKFLDRIEIVRGNVAKKNTWKKIKGEFDYLFHFAAPSSITLFNKYPRKCYKETVFGMWNALEFSKENDIKKFVYPSSGSVYAGNEYPHKEIVYPKPRNLYAAAKIACEGLANSYSDFVDSVGLRIFAGYGPGEEWKKDFASVIYLFIKDMMNNKSPIIFGDGEQKRDFIYVEDVVRAIIKTAEIKYTGIINIGTGKPVSFNQVVSIINKMLGKSIKPKYISRPKNYVNYLKADTGLMKKLLKLAPIDIRDGIKKFVNYLKS